MKIFDNSIFTRKEKQVIFSLLTRVMDADAVRREEEISYLESIAADLSVSKEDIAQSNEISLDECKEILSTFDDNQRAEVKRILVEMAYADGVYVRQEEELIKSLKLDISRQELELIAEWRDEEQRIVGFYTCKKDGNFCIEDIRSLRFSELKYKDDGEIVIDVKQIPELTLNKYYEFSWTTELDDSERGFHVIPREYKFKEVQAKELVDRLYNNWKNKDYDTIKQMSEVQRMVNTQLTASSDGTFIYELLQNANDYPVVVNNHVQLVDVEFRITDHYLIYRHTGRYFSPRNIAAISKMSDGEKKKEKNAIGYKGIGFKTVFSENQYVYLKSGEYTLRFDESITRKGLGSSKFPWQLMPIWTPLRDVDQEVLDELTDEKSFRVQMAIRPDDSSKLRVGEKSYEYIFNDIFQDEKDILFIPNIKSVTVFYNGVEQIRRIKDPEKWVLTEKPLIYKFTTDEIEENNREVIANKRIPEKYKDFEDTRVSFACRRKGRKIEPVEKARIYCYLPTQVSLGFPFLMNTDMIPTGPRDDFEKKIKFNHKIMKIAGGKLAEWISSLLHSGEFDLCSIFTIIPSFEKVENYEDFIEEFKDGFDSQLDDLELIPCENGEYSVIYDTIIDETGILTSGILSDEEFMELSQWEGSLPAKELRTNRKFKSFVKKYIDSSNVFDTDALRDMVRGDKFKEWLKIQENNDKFLRFLLENDYLKDYFEEAIFIEEDCGNLFSARDLYYDIDEELRDLFAFSSQLFYLSFKTREFFKDNEKWNDLIKDEFDEFDGESFINDTLLGENWDDTIQSLNDWETSYHFYRYLAKNNIVPSDLCSLPFFSDDSEPEVVEDFDDKFVFLSSAKGKNACRASWLSSVTFCFVSPKYDMQTLDYFKVNAGVRIYSDDIIINDIILSDDYQESINEAQQESIEASISFVKFCFEHASLFESGSLRNYALNAYDCNGEDDFVLSENHIYFPSAVYDGYAEKKWLDSDWMYSLNSDYLEIGQNEKQVKIFLVKAFYIEDIDTETFYEEIVRPNISAIISNTSGSRDADGLKNLDFISYLDDNYKLIFEQEKDSDKFDDFVLLGDTTDGGFYDIDANSTYIYANDAELNDILDSEWFPEDTVKMCSSKYGDSKAVLAIKANKYDFANFFNDVITEELGNINETIDTKEASIAFHGFIVERLSDLTDKQKEVMKGAKVYLYGNDEPSDRSEGHHILSKSARELSSLGLVEFSDLDIIDPDYHVEENEDYWRTRLGNEQFTITDFITWLNNNTDDFYSTIEDKDYNIKFWRWVKGCKLADQTIANLPVLPIYLTSDEYVDTNETIYLSDAYIEDGGWETIVKNYHPDASFISDEYLSDGDNIDTWKDFWVKLGIRFEMVDVLVDTIDNRLAETDDAKLPATIAKYRLKLDEHYEGELISNLTDLRVKAHDGEFYSLSEIVYIDCEKEEPFNYIDIPNQVSFATADERKLIIDILDEIDGDKIVRLTEWREAKINRYLEIQDDEENENLLRSIHFRFVDELAAMYNADKDSLKDFEDISDVLFLNSEDEFADISSMTEGSPYYPFCDFEAYGLDYSYISDSYLEECTNDIRKMFNRIFHIHCDFEKDDIKNLANRDFAIYFWSKYLIRRDADISGVKRLIDDREFDTVACIPTKDCMKKPSELYSLKISPYVIRHIDNWENKLPLKDLPNIEYDKEEHLTLFGLLLNKPSNLRLSFCDALYALFSISGQDRRSQLLQWMIETYDEKYDVNIEEYRADESALWKNTKNEDKPITELYALSYNDKKLEQYFGNLPQIINKDYLPAGPISFRNACDILKITTIEPTDLVVDPIGQVLKTASYTKTLKVYALVLSGYEDSEDWSSRYKKYSELIDSIELWCCNAISIRYELDECICQNLKKFYHEKGTTEFYFVKSLDEKRVFNPFVESFIEYLGIEADKDFVETVMESLETAIDLVKENNTLLIDENFKDELDLLIPGIKRELSGNEADDEDVFDNDKRHTFTGHTEYDGQEEEPAIEGSEPKQDEDNYYNGDIEPKDEEENEGEGHDIEFLREEEFEDDNKREALNSSDTDLDEDDFCNISKLYYNYNGEEIETVCEHYRSGTWVRGHFRNGHWVNGYWRNGSNVSAHTRTSSTHGVNSYPARPQSTSGGVTRPSSQTTSESEDNVERDTPKSTSHDKGAIHGIPTNCEQRERKPHSNTHPTRASEGTRGYGDMAGWEGSRGNHTPQAPKPFSPEDVRNFGSRGVTRTLEILEPQSSEVDEINRILGEDLSPEQVADQNYLAQLRLYKNLQKKGFTPDESIDDFVRNAHLKNEHTVHTAHGGKYIHKCSAAGGIMYLSPSIWNKIADERCVVCVYLGAKANDFMYFNSIEDILKWIKEDDIVIKLTGEEKADVVKELYSGVLEGVKGTAYTLIRINSNEKYNSVFAPLAKNDINETEEDASEYE